MKNKFLYQLLSGVSQVMVPLLSYPYVSRILGPERLGKINYVDFLTQMFIIFASFGIPYYAIREVAVVRNEPEKRSKLVAELVLLHLAFSLTALFVFVLSTSANWVEQRTLYLLATANILFSTFTVDWYLQGTEAFGAAAVRYFLVRAGVLIAIFLLVHRETDDTLYFTIHSLGFMAIALWNSRKMFGENRFSGYRIELKRHLRPLAHFFLTSSAITLYIYFDTVLLQHFTRSDLQVGYYTTAVKLVKIFLIGLLAIGTVLMPRISFLVSTGKQEEAGKQLQKNLEFLVVSGLPVSIGLLALAPETIRVVVGDKFIPATTLIRILSFIPFVIALGNLYCFQILVPFKKEKNLLLLVSMGCLLSIGLNLLLIPRMGASGSAWANIITESAIALFAGIQAARCIQLKFPLKLILGCTACCLPFFPIISGLRHITESPFSIFVLAVAGCAASYFLLLKRITGSRLVEEARQSITGFFSTTSD
jgi:O-antigen/teichoic acid export membrane protein